MASSGSKKIAEDLRRLPGVDILLEDQRIKPLVKKWSQPLVVSFIRKVLSDCRKKIRSGERFPGESSLKQEITRSLESYTAGILREVINATGIIVHTNLGRAPLPEEMLSEIAQISAAYSNLEFDLTTGKRGKRGAALRQLISVALGCESALVVNNNASAVFLILSELARGREVLVSRGELVQIGGGFKIPEILSASGAILKEVGTTNRTSLNDYRKAIGSETALILKVHRSNFVIEGFSEEVDYPTLVGLGKKKRIPVAIDLGSGLILPPSQSGLDREPTVFEALRSKADLICFSGDKLLGGVQAGIIIGRARLINRLNKNPIYRVVRPDKLVIGMLERLFLCYLRGDVDIIPIWPRITESRDDLLKRTRKFIESINLPEGSVTIRDGVAYAGGGSDPGGKIPSVLIAFNNIAPAKISNVMRGSDPPVIGRTEGGRFCLDLRTVMPRQEDRLAVIIEETVRKLT